VNLGASDRLGNSSVVTVSSGTLGIGANNDFVSTFAITGGTLDGTGTLWATSYSLGGGTLNANLGVGFSYEVATASSGTTTLNGTLAANLIVNGGTVNLGSSDRLVYSRRMRHIQRHARDGFNNNAVGSFAISGGTLAERERLRRFFTLSKAARSARTSARAPPCDERGNDCFERHLGR